MFYGKDGLVELKNKIINDDVHKTLLNIPDDSVDLIITSPPYNLGNDHHTGNKRHMAYSDNLPENIYQEQQIDVLNECYRILRHDGSMFYNHKNRIRKGEQITPYQWLLKTQFIIKQELVWFNRSQNFDKIRFYPMTERIYWLTKSPKTKLFNAINHHDVFDTKDWPTVGTKGKHTRAFPVEMPRDIIKCFSDAELIFDPYMGSGTVAVAALMEGRNYFGIEINPEFIDIANNRINQYLTEIDRHTIQ